MSKRLRSYTPEFRTESVKLALDTNSVAQAAKDLGIPISTLHSWISQSRLITDELKTESKSRETTVNIKLLLEKNKELQKRIARLEQEKSILKKAATYFAREIG
jgi:transposase